VATGPNHVCSWDITKLRGPAKWTYYHLYVILDIYSRYAVGWTAASRESAALAEKLIAETCAKQGTAPGQLSLHADRGSSMTSKPVAVPDLFRHHEPVRHANLPARSAYNNVVVTDSRQAEDGCPFGWLAGCQSSSMPLCRD
jgi:Integrase core domain